MPARRFTKNTIPVRIHSALANNTRQLLPAPSNKIETIIQRRLDINIWAKPVCTSNDVIAEGMKGRYHPGTRREMSTTYPTSAMNPCDVRTRTSEVAGSRPDTSTYGHAMDCFVDMVGEVRRSDIGVGFGEGFDEVCTHHCVIECEGVVD